MIRYGQPRQRSARGNGFGRLIVALVIAVFAVISFLGSQEFNPVTGEKQYVALSQNQEIALGAQAAPEMIQIYGGLLPDREAQDFIDNIGAQLIQTETARNRGWQWEFYLLADPNTINAFALPGGQVFITEGLLAQLETEGQVAGVLGHEITHVLARHSAQQLAKQQLTEGLTGAVLVATDPNSAHAAAVIGELVNMQFGRDDELESDRIGVQIMSQAGYDPRAMIGVMQILARISGSQEQPEFFSTHPNPENRIDRIQDAINVLYPNSVPDNLRP